MMQFVEFFPSPGFVRAKYFCLNGDKNLCSYIKILKSQVLVVAKSAVGILYVYTIQNAGENIYH